MLVEFKEHIKQRFPFLKGKKILVAISGGIDSVVLTHLLNQSTFDIALAHCNFSLRGKESDADEQFVKQLAKQLGVKVYTIVFDTRMYADENGLSTQMAARELRYEWFHKICQDNGLDYIATAHHLDDNLETFLINFTRGTGLNGLTGIPEIKSNIVRPLLPFSREEIESFAEDNKLTWREDESNAKTAYQRNKIRHQIVPLLKEMNPNLLTTFQKTTNHLKDSQRIITDTIESVKKTVVSHAATGSIQKLDIKKLKQFENPKAYLFELLKSYGFSEWNDIVALLDAQSGKQVFSASHRLLKDRDYLLLTEINSAQANKVIYEIQEGQEILPLEHFKLLLKRVDLENQHADATNSVCMDIDKLTFPLRLRKMKTGDYFFPLGMAGKKKVSKFFKDEKLSLIEKENTWLLCSNNDIVWVVNRRLDDRYKVQHNTKNILQVEFLQV